MLIFISHRNLKKLEKIMSQFLDDFRAALEKVSVGTPGDPETKAAVAELQAKLTSNDATDAEQSTAIMELTEKLANSVPATVGANDGPADIGASNG